IEWRQENVTEDGRNHTPLGSTALTGKEPPFAVAAGLEHRLDKAKHSAVRHSLGYEGEKLLVIDRPEKISEICIHHPLPPRLVSLSRSCAVRPSSIALADIQSWHHRISAQRWAPTD